jgi:hypothetical protein
MRKIGCQLPGMNTRIGHILEMVARERTAIFFKICVSDQVIPRLLVHPSYILDPHVDIWLLGSKSKETGYSISPKSMD